MIIKYLKIILKILIRK